MESWKGNVDATEICERRLSRRITPRRMVELAAEQPGFLGVESVRGEDGFGITVSYWESEEAIRNWKAHLEHAKAQEAGQGVWYAGYQLRVARVERQYGSARAA